MKFGYLLPLILFTSGASAQTITSSDVDRVLAGLDSTRMRTHLSVLADDSMEGRAPGTPGGRRAADYIAGRFRELRLTPAGDPGTYFQDFQYRLGGSNGETRLRPGWDGTGTKARNVIGLLRAEGPDADEYVVIGGHFDAYGIGRAINGDSIYNGTEDNAAGVAQLLTLAEAFARSGVRLKRSIIFVAFDAEEPGLIGAKAFVEHPPVARAGMIAMINLDAANLYGATRDAAALGLRESTLDGTFRRAAGAEGMTVAPVQPDSIEAFFLRSDQLPFARAGIPALFPFVGWDFVGRTPAWALEQWNRYFAERYHMPSDQYQPWFSMRGAVQQARVVARMVMEIANADGKPAWHPESRFRR